MAFATPVRTSEQSIDRVLHAGLPVVLIFDRHGCPTCQQLDGVIDRLAKIFAGLALLARVDADDNPSLVRRYRVVALPGLVFIKNGVPVAQTTGAVSEESLRAWLTYLAEGGEQPPLPTGPSVPLTRAVAHPTFDAHAAQGGESGRSVGIKPVTLSDSTFDQVVARSDQPVLVDFWAPWCGPCRAVAPAVERLAQEFAGRAVVAQLNVDDNPRTAQRFGISSIPTLYIFKRGRVVERLIGAQPYPVLRQALARHSGLVAA
ncbi:MAG: thioredoxin [Roseiflexus sp.]